MQLGKQVQAHSELSDSLNPAEMKKRRYHPSRTHGKRRVHSSERVAPFDSRSSRWWPRSSEGMKSVSPLLFAAPVPTSELKGSHRRRCLSPRSACPAVAERRWAMFAILRRVSDEDVAFVAVEMGRKGWTGRQCHMLADHRKSQPRSRVACAAAGQSCFVPAGGRSSFT